MKGYELTDRGKIIIAVILVICILVLPAVVLAVNAWSNSLPPPENPSQHTPPAGDQQPEISDRPLPDGSGLNPQDPPKNEDGEQGSFDPPQELPAEPPEFGPVNFNRTAGTMMFKFSPDKQEALDAETISMIGDFITSPRNTADARIIIEMPQLSEDDTSLIIAAITAAFAEHGVAQGDLSYIVNQSNTVEGAFEVKLYFSQAAEKK